MVTGPLVLIFSHCPSAEHGSVAPFPDREARPQVHLVPQDTHVSGITAEPWLPGSGVRRAGGCSHVASCWGIRSLPCRTCQPAGHRATAVTSAGSTQALALLAGTRPAPDDSTSPPPPLLLQIPLTIRPVFIKCFLWARPSCLVPFHSGRRLRGAGFLVPISR